MMYEKSSSHARLFVEAANSNNHHLQQQLKPFGDTFQGVGSDLIKKELGAYKEKILGSSSAYVQSNISRYFSNPQCYFQVNDDYVKNKLKVVLFPFLHGGPWMRSTNQVGGELSYKPPIHDINAPDLYIPVMAFGTYLVLAGFFLGINGKFSPEALGVQFTNGILCWLMQVLLLETVLHWLGGGEVPVLDMVAYGGYTFVAASVVVLARIVWGYSFLAITMWECLWMGVFLVKTMKRILVSEVRSFDKNSSKRHYLLLLMAFAQIPLLFWLGHVSI